MENKINIAELLKDCPKGMELDCTIYGNVTLEYVVKSSSLPICIRIQNRSIMFLSRYGQLHDEDCCKCVIFPKGKTTWEGFVPPCQFKDGDIITCNNSACTFVSIFKDKPNGKSFRVHCTVMLDNNKFIVGIKYADYANPRFAIEEEKATLFKSIIDNGYKWNEETKTLEKLINPKFKVGDIVRSKNCIDTGNFIIVGVEENSYSINIKNYCIEFKDQDNYELVSNKFDINTLKPFDSRVLIRDAHSDLWKPAIFGCYLKDAPYLYYTLGGMRWKQCIPYEKNEHLLGTTDNCDDYYKTW